MYKKISQKIWLIPKIWLIVLLNLIFKLNSFNSKFLSDCT